MSTTLCTYYTEVFGIWYTKIATRYQNFVRCANFPIAWLEGFDLASCAEFACRVRKFWGRLQNRVSRCSQLYPPITPKLSMWSGICMAAWKLKVRNCIPESRLHTCFSWDISFLIFVLSNSTSETRTFSRRSQVSSIMYSSSSLIQSWICCFLPKCFLYRSYFFA